MLLPALNLFDFYIFLWVLKTFLNRTSKVHGNMLKGRQMVGLTGSGFMQINGPAPRFLNSKDWYLCRGVR